MKMEVVDLADEMGLHREASPDYADSSESSESARLG